ncbi:hypothetical protein BGX38DRAFT_1246266 [Terfezia claveryi]|nr:hypothetical protein BGX38DRAFT_1246266 [Terfezia claveryi]
MKAFVVHSIPCHRPMQGGSGGKQEIQQNYKLSGCFPGKAGLFSCAGGPY